MKLNPTTFISRTVECFKSLLATLACLYNLSRTLVSSFLGVNPFWLQLGYFFTIFTLGYFVLVILEPRNPIHPPRKYDIFFTAVSATTVASMATIEMEVLSNTQLFCLGILMLLGGEVFTSMLELQIKKFKLLDKKVGHQVNSASCDPSSNMDIEDGVDSSTSNLVLKYSSMKFLGVVILSYFLTVQVTGFLLVCLYVGLVPSAKQVLTNKKLNLQVFSTVTIISTFTNCGYLPTNESMMVFKKNLGLLVILIPIVLLGNTLYPVFLRLVLILLRKVSSRKELEYVLTNHAELGYFHLLPGMHCWSLALTSMGFIVVQLVAFISLAWKSPTMEGLNPVEKIIGSLFQVVNTRHTGESVFDLYLVPPGIIVIIATMMYLPPYTYFLPSEDKGSFPSTHNDLNKRQKKGSMLLSPLAFLVIMVMFICISEGENFQKDPLNFSVLNVMFEVISAYGGVGFSMGYSCKRQLQPHQNCRDAWYGFAGRWNDISKLILVLVMIYGRLKKFYKNGGKAWKLS